MSDIISQIEEMTGQRYETNNFDNDTMTTLFGLVAREMGLSKHKPEDNFVAGTLVKHQLTLDGQRERETDELVTRMLLAGLSPDDVKSLLG